MSRSAIQQQPEASAGVHAAVLDAAMVDALAQGRCADPFALLGPHQTPQGRILRAFLPGALAVEALDATQAGLLAPFEKLDERGLFGALAPGDGPYLLRTVWPDATFIAEDPYSFWEVLPDEDLALFAAGCHPRLTDLLGAREMWIADAPGVRFSVWAPNARAVSVVGDFNGWDRRRHPMRLRHGAGVWELFVPRIGAGEHYKFAIVDCNGRELPLKADPMALRTQAPPETASVVAATLDHVWQDGDWMAGRAARQAPDAPISIYEVHLGSWLRKQEAEPDWDEAARRLPSYAAALGFTHVELLPIAEYPFGGSWGYQPLSLFAPTARHGDPAGFARFVDACHAAGLGVILDWAPHHFPNDAHGLVRFDGTALYEHEDPQEGLHPDWDTVLYNFGRREVRNFLIASALRWLEQFHVDGLRVDAVASMLYRDYSRAEGAWKPNEYGGRENLEAIDFLRAVNSIVASRCPGAMMIAEESTAWPGVTARVEEGGLGFSYKWNMGWMNDTLRYMARDPIHRRWHHDEMTFGMMYAFAEKFVLAVSHDEVVHGKRSLLDKMPGDEWRKRANLRAYFALMWTHPGKKLLFMGAEFGQWREWSHDRQLDWHLFDEPGHAGLVALLRDLNRLYRDEPALHASDAKPGGFEWLVVDDRENCVFAYVRRGADGRPIVIALNLTPQPRSFYRIGVPQAGFWKEVINTDATCYGGTNTGNLGGAQTRETPAHGHAQSLELVLPPLAAVVLRLDHETERPYG
ncbi:MAG: 1,4-alpha-glucan branching protein GlgB [Methylobacteriaceae bacterium]|nr:1,4-alpha-glucan branching protein GlgB [Rhodoblastus sp.]MCC0005069.1 1,4-alpha-glucan branching protein GlgB [Methylobacteriaceae bacterium]